MTLSSVIATAFVVAASLGPTHAQTLPLPSADLSLSNTSITHTTKYSHDISANTLTDDEREFIARINMERRDHGLNTLVPDFQLVQIARAHSYDMCARNYFSHIAPVARLHSPMDRYLSDLHLEGLPTPDHLTVGENIYYCSGSRNGNDVAFANQELMNSPEHRDNILNPSYDRVGVGVWRDAQGQLWVTENFLSDAD